MRESEIYVIKFSFDAKRKRNLPKSWQMILFNGKFMTTAPVKHVIYKKYLVK